MLPCLLSSYLNYFNSCWDMNRGLYNSGGALSFYLKFGKRINILTPEYLRGWRALRLTDAGNKRSCHKRSRSHLHRLLNTGAPSGLQSQLRKFKTLFWRNFQLPSVWGRQGPTEQRRAQSPPSPPAQSLCPPQCPAVWGQEPATCHFCKKWVWSRAAELERPKEHFPSFRPHASEHKEGFQPHLAHITVTLRSRLPALCSSMFESQW